MKRIYHTYEKWECYPAGFYENQANGKSKEDCEREYASFLRDLPAFESALERVLKDWPISCEHYLSNESMNRIAWLGQASMCIARQVPSCYRGGFNLLSEAEQKLANELALKFLNRWLRERGEPELTFEQASSKTDANLY